QIADRLADEALPSPGVPELAALCGLGRRHFMRAFKVRTGLTVMEWVERAMFDRATRLLEQEGVSIKQVSALLGYSHPGSFASAFARRFGLSPREWRSRNATRH
ncbi:helix-turn-helix domain-containing protein, partial [Sphingobium sp.]|uniref:helix-turn-helix domain-containing protein n=1 Tax=Sphingobium sp. TaxID=1912891 RepID=UPI0035C6C648